MKPIQRADVVIVGAGPAGSAAAYDLAAAGFSTLLLDKAVFPRLKPCAGGLTVKTLKALRFSAAPVIQRRCDVMAVALGSGPARPLRAAAPVAAMTVRSELDAFCLEKACEAGASFVHIGPIREIQRRDNGWRVVTDGVNFEGRWLIGADGANSQVRRLLRPDLDVRFGMAVEVCMPVGNPARYDMEMAFGVVDRGYGWVFPKGIHLNLGLYALTSIPHAKARLRQYVRERLGREAREGAIVGHRIPFNGHRFRHRPGDPLLAGDAAGLLDPLLGEGIYHAVRSGQIAAAAIGRMAAGEADCYGAMMREITDELASYWFYTRLFYANIAQGYRLLTAAPVRYSAMKGYALGWTIGRVKSRFFRLPFLSWPQPGETAVR